MKKLNGYWQWIGHHEWRMKSPGDTERDNLSGTGSSREFHRLLHAFEVTAHHDLTRRIEVRRHAYAVFDARAYILDGIVVEPQDCGHRTGAILTGFKHEFTPTANRHESVFEREGSCRDVRAELAE